MTMANDGADDFLILDSGREVASATHCQYLGNEFKNHNEMSRETKPIHCVS